MTERPALRPWTDNDLRVLSDEVGVSIGAPSDREAAERDFGQLARRPTLALLVPRSVEQVERIVAFANTRGLALTPRGRGMSQGGQSLPAAGVSLDLSQLVEIGPLDVDARTLRCSAGTTWRNVVTTAAPKGLLPKVAPLNLDLSVGGLLSVAGVGATSHTYGAAVACVAELEIVTGAGARLTCSPSHNASVYRTTLGGMGRAGLIVGAHVELRPFRPQVRTFYLLFDSIRACLAAQRTLIESSRADYLEAFCTPCVQGMREGPRGRAPFAQWFYSLHVTVEYEPGAIPAKDDILSGLETFRLVHVEDGDTIAFASRYDARFSAMRKSGAWTQPHPWVEALLPGGNTEEILRDILELYPVSLGDGPRLFFVDRRSSPPFLRMPDDPVIACCALLPVAIPPHILSDTLDAFRAIHARILRHGGKRILSGWITMMDDAALRDHYGDQWPDWVAAKRVMDPAGILDSPLTQLTSS